MMLLTTQKCNYLALVPLNLIFETFIFYLLQLLLSANNHYLQSLDHLVSVFLEILQYYVSLGQELCLHCPKRNHLDRIDFWKYNRLITGTRQWLLIILIVIHIWFFNCFPGCRQENHWNGLMLFQKEGVLFLSIMLLFFYKVVFTETVKQ